MPIILIALIVDPMLKNVKQIRIKFHYLYLFIIVFSYIVALRNLKVYTLIFETSQYRSISSTNHEMMLIHMYEYIFKNVFCCHMKVDFATLIS
jgi:hypothetical protein